MNSPGRKLAFAGLAGWLGWAGLGRAGGWAGQSWAGLCSGWEMGGHHHQRIFRWLCYPSPPGATC